MINKKLSNREVFFKELPLRDFLLLMFFEEGEIKPFMKRYRPEDDFDKELIEMKNEKLVEIGKNDDGKEIYILKLPDGYDLLDKVLKEWPIYSLNYSEKIIRSVALRSLIKKMALKQND